MDGAGLRAPRADAARNRERLLATASRLFVARGPDVPYTVIAREAGVGVGTVYRHFPSREALIEAAYRAELDAVCAAAPALLGALQPGAALRAWMDRFFDYMSTKIGMADAIRLVIAGGGDPYAHSRDVLDRALATLLEATVDAGVTRPGIEPDDVLLSLSGIAMAAGEPEQRAQAARMLDLLHAGLRA